MVYILNMEIPSNPEGIVSVAEQYKGVVNKIDTMTQAKSPEGEGDVSSAFFEALTLFPYYSNEKVAGMGTGLRGKEKLQAHEELRDLYIKGAKASAMQGTEIPGNQTIQLISAQGIVDQTRHITDIALASNKFGDK